MILYHGSGGITEYLGIKKTNYMRDFYFGFYCTECREQAVRQAVRYGRDGYLNEYNYTFDSNLNVLNFDRMSDAWLNFVIACRNGKSHGYDIVEGPMVDDIVYNYLQNYLDGKISRNTFWELAQERIPVRQTSFHTISALDTIEFIEAHRVVDMQSI